MVGPIVRPGPARGQCGDTARCSAIELINIQYAARRIRMREVQLARARCKKPRPATIGLRECDFATATDRVECAVRRALPA